MFGMLAAPGIRAAAAPALKGAYRPDRVLIRPRADVDRASLAAWHSSLQVRVKYEFPDLDDLQVLELPPGRLVEPTLNAYLASGLIERAEPDFILHSLLAPNDPDYISGKQWGLENNGQNGEVADADIDAPEAWDGLASAAGIVVAVIDSGVRYTHEDLRDNLWRNPGEIAGNGIDDDRNGIIDDVHGLNALLDTGEPMDVAGHGTHVAGIIGATGNNGKGLAGVAWTVQLMVCRFIDNTGNGSVSDAIQCIDYARTKGAHVINASWGGTSYSSFLEGAIRKTRDAGIIFVAAAGNEGADTDVTPFYPACFDLDNIVAVAATTSSDNLASYSNFGASAIHLAAPGSSIYSAYNASDTSYAYFSGTSMAAPFVAGAVALMRARYPTEPHRQILDRILAATDPLPALTGKCVTAGRLNLYRALGPALAADFAASPASGDFPLTVQFTDRSFGDIESWVWDFGDGTPDSTARNPSHTYEQPGEFTATLTVDNGAGLTSSRSRSIAVVANYTMQAAAFDWIDPDAMPVIVLSNDGVSPAISLPFEFHYYGRSYRQFYVAANGLIGFLPEDLGANSNTDLPDADLPNAVVAPYWDDLNPADNGAIHIGTLGETPHRRTVISWVRVRHASLPRTDLTFQIVLHETGHMITFQYLEVRPERPQGAGRRATVGLENETGLVARKYSYNGSALLANGQAIGFLPASISSMTVTPYSDFTAEGDTGGPFSPSSQGYEVANTGNTTLHWTAGHAADWITLSAQSGTLPPGEVTSVSVSISPAASALPAGSYHDTITFVNTDSGIGNTERAVHLTVHQTAPALEVSPEWALEASGTAGGLFSPTSILYTLVNTGDAPLEWSANHSETWVTLSAAGGLLAAGADATVQIAINPYAGLLSPGTYADTVTFLNLTSDKGSTSRNILLTLSPLSDALRITPPANLTFDGFAGTLPEPDTFLFDLANTGDTAMDWTFNASEEWVTAVPNGGTLEPATLAPVSVRLQAVVPDLPAGSYTNTLRFTDVANARTENFQLVLQVWPLPSLRLLDYSRATALIELELSGPPEQTFVIETSTDLRSWQATESVTLDSSGAARITAPAGGVSGQNFRLVHLK